MIDFRNDFMEEVCEPEAAYSINRELNLAWEIIEETGMNLFLTGRAGTGKTTFLKQLREDSSKRMIVLAPTGVAAINASGSTLHSFFQLPIAPYIPGKGFLTDDNKFLNVSKQKKRLIASLSLLVIDEISMVRPDMLDAIDSILRRLRGSSQPFGGLQLLLIGDLRQLPPVIKEAEWNLLKEHYASPYFFESHALKKAGYLMVELSVVYRQSDTKFLNILNCIRDGRIERSTLELLNRRCVKNAETMAGEGVIRLTTHNNRATSINENKLSELPGPEFFYTAEIEGTFPQSSFPCEENLRLKEGAQVMFIKNDTGGNRSYYNGLIGTVHSLADDKIMVRIPGGSVIEVGKMEWENTRYIINETTKQVSQETIGLFRQYPLQLAWAITIHKSQGLTFEKAIIDASHSFAPGQTYVALSRCRSLDSLFLEARIPAHAVITDKEMNDFVAYCEANTPDSEKINLLKASYLYILFTELFDFEPLRINYLEFLRYARETFSPLYPELVEKLDEYLGFINSSIYDVAHKFTEKYNEDAVARQLSLPGSHLSERIKKGSEYFIQKLEKLGSFLAHLPNGIKKKTFASRLDNLYASLVFQVRLKLMVFKELQDKDFTVQSYLKAKSDAILHLDGSVKKRKG